jgi:hypothetical protein
MNGKSHRGFGSLIIVLVVGIAVLGGAYYAYTSKPSQEESTAAGPHAAPIVAVPDSWKLVKDDTTNGIHLEMYISPDSNATDPVASITVVTTPSSNPNRPLDLVNQDKDFFSDESEHFKTSTRVISGTTIYDEEWDFRNGKSHTRFSTFSKDGKLYRVSGTYTYDSGSMHAATIETALDSIAIP